MFNYSNVSMFICGQLYDIAVSEYGSERMGGCGYQPLAVKQVLSKEHSLI